MPGFPKHPTPNRRWILLRGLGRSSGHWMHFPAALKKRFADDQVVTLDLPGNGELFRLDSPATVHEMTADYRRQLIALKVTPPYHLVALSLGGMVALDWLNRHPDEIELASVVNSSNGAFNTPLQRFRPAAIRALMTRGLLGKPALERAVYQFTCNLAPQARVVAHFTDLAQRHPVAKKNMLRQIKAAARFNLPRIAFAHKLMLVNAAGDQLVAPACSAAMAHQWQLPLVTHPDAGHDLAVDDPEWLVNQLETRLKAAETPLPPEVDHAL